MPPSALFDLSDTASDAKSNPVITTVLNTHIDTLTTSKDMAKVTLLKEVFESAFQTLVRVELLVLFSFLHPLISDRTKTR